MTGVVSLYPGALVGLADGETYLVVKFRSAETVLVEHRETFRRKVVPLEEIRPAKASQDDTHDVSPEQVTDSKWEAAKEKYLAVKRVEELGGGEANVKVVAAELEVHPATIYRWISDYKKAERVADLYRRTRSDVGKTRLSPRQEAMMRRVIRDFHLSEERPTITASHNELDRRCKLKKLKTPSLDTFKARIAMCPSLEMAEARGQVKLANKLRLNKGKLTGADFPYAVVQIDHTRVDLMLVDGEYRIPIGRPWITVAIDVFSRMCVGYYVSFDPPGMLGTGLCLTHAILNKQKWMAKIGVDYDYPCQGVPGIVHADNAKEFRGNDLRVVCDLHNMSLQFRKVKRPRYGGHIERLMGTLMKEIHALPGTTFSGIADKEEYDSEGNAVFTLARFEKWLAHLILGVYHNRPHSGLNDTPPIVMFKRGLVGTEERPTGSLRIETDEERLYMDFLPSVQQTVQQYGVQIDKIQYSGDVLRRWVGARDPNAPTKSRKFTFKRDPRDISVIFFKDPETDRYFRIPYKNLSNPHISVWELRKIRKYLKLLGRKDVDEATIFAARNAMHEIRMSEEEETKAARKRGRYSRETQEAKRRAESPQPEHGHAAPGRPQVLASQDAAPNEGQPQPTETVTAAPAATSSAQTPAAGRTAEPKKPAAPFDEIEDY